MPKRLVPMVLVLLAAACAGGPGARLSSSGGETVIEVKFREALGVRQAGGELRGAGGEALEGVNAVLRRHGALEVAPLVQGPGAARMASWYRVVLPPDADPARAAADLAALPEVEHAQPAPRPAPPPAG